jgi:lipopolysaccharide biosynthesis glycosyltransferase
LLNLEEFRKSNILENFKDCIEDFNGNPPVLSEGVINKVCKGRIKILHPKYNMMSGLFDYRRNRFANMISYYDEITINEAIQFPVIIHYLSAFYNRPWNIYCTHPMKDIYLHYKSLSFWKNSPLERRKLNFKLRLIKFLYTVLPNDLLDFIHYIKNRRDY